MLLGQYTTLLITLLALYVLSPFAPFFFVGRVSLILLDVLVSAMLLAAVYALHQRKRLLVLGAVFALPAVLGRWASYAVQNPTLFGVGQVRGFLFLAFTTGAVLSRVLRDQRVTADTVNGALCVYLMLGVTWTWLFSVLEFFLPGSFRLPDIIAGQESVAQLDAQRLSQFLYFSLVTLTTLGYGDIIPVTRPASNLAALEAVVGQLYIAVLVARLVGLHVAHSMGGRKEDDNRGESEAGDGGLDVRFCI